MNTLEDRLRTALRSRAESFPVDPGAWQEVQRRAERSPRGARPRPPAGLARGKFAVPAVAAAAVTALILAIAWMVGPFGLKPAAGPSGPAAAALKPPKPPGRSDYLVKLVPPSSPIIRLRLAVGRQTTWTFFWVGHTWQGLELCAETYKPAVIPAGRRAGTISFAGGGACEPRPSLRRGEPVHSVLWGSEYPGPLTWVGVAASSVRSVLVVLPDGRRFPGALGTGRGFPYQVWVVGYPFSHVAGLTFFDASGHAVAHLGVRTPTPQARQGPPPNTKGVPVFSYRGEESVYNAGNGTTTRQGTVSAYLTPTHIEFWSPAGGPFGPSVPVKDGPVLSGRFGDYLVFGQLEWFGVARSDVALVTVRLTDGGSLSAATFHPSWATSDKLFAVRLPQDLYGKGGVMGRPPRGTATAYDAAGHVLAQVPLGAE
jgi:hypothetical protein